MTENNLQSDANRTNFNQLLTLTRQRKNRRAEGLQQRLKIISNFSRLMAVLLFLAGSYQVYLNLTQGTLITLNVISSYSMVVISVVAAFLARPNATPFRADLAAYLFTLGLAGLISFVLANTAFESGRDTLIVSLFALPLVGGLLGLKGRDIFILSFVNYFGLIAGNLAAIYIYKMPGMLPQNFPASYYVYLGLAFFAISYGTFIFTRRVFVALDDVESQAESLTKLLLNINSTNEFGVSLGRDLSSVASELNATSNEHAAYTQEQVASLAEVTTSLEELSETATQIAGSAHSASEAARRVVEIANEVQATSSQAALSSQEGTRAVEEAALSVERVRNRIELLGQRLLNLTEQTRRVGSIIDIIDEIADETHLLALNASIEAAGNVQTTNQTAGTSTFRSERFGVIAQEVKNLSDRSRESTEEVRQAISEMQGAVAAAVLVAEEGKKDTASALSRSEIAGRVIEKLNNIINNSATKAETILQASEEVKTRCEEISLATGQQRSANQQILLTMRNVSNISQQNAETVYSLSETASRINNQVERINKVLASSVAEQEPSAPVAA